MSAKVPRRRVVVAVAGIVLAALALVWTGFQTERQGAQIDALYEALTVEQQGVEDRGESPIAPPPEELIDDPDAEIPAGPPGPPGPSGPPGPGVSEDDLDAAVARHFEKYPYQGELSPAELAAAFAALLTEHPDAVNDQIYAAISTYLTENPPPPGPPGADGQDGADGADGAQGEPGRPPTKDEIRTEVEAYIEENGLPICPPDAPAGPLTVVTPGGPVDIIACIVPNQPE
ncbi:hypothetical protein [Glycomyces lechevalierae]|uniref:Type II secretory pathway pseudopilin PulG n=1 Tax=Glycomyces lechevalierae TaxID=256034 RepID=A0ABU2AK90_9ACTN|nr:hypothetical protein [Glycomyces lechevalierae]MDR7336852.1 type II secretory pathway pseudopilin PulG [Glycomyces lechevalierae]